MENLVKKFAQINSNTFNIEGLSSMRKELAAAFGHLSAQIGVIPTKPIKRLDQAGKMVETPLGATLHLVQRPHLKRQILLMGHMDTVFREEPEIFKEKNRLIGPGVADMKAGLVIMLKLLERVEASDFASRIGWEVIINADEEIGTPATRSFIEECAKGKECALIFEPALPNGNLVSKRAGSLNFAVLSKGKSTHAGRDFFEGENAITKLGKALLEAERLVNKSQGITVNIATIHGGETLNTVPGLAFAQINVRAKEPKDFEDVEAKLQTIFQSFELFTLSKRPPKLLDAKTEKLFQLIQEIDPTIAFESSGGVCDGNITSYSGVPTIDTLGGVGGNLHQKDEYLEISSLEKRLELAFQLVKKIAEGNE